MTLNKFIASQSGWATPFALYFTLFLLILGGLAVDTSRAYHQRTILMAAADSAVLAAAQELPDAAAARAVGLQYIETFFPPGRYGTVATADDFVFGRWDPETGILDTEAEMPDAVALHARFSNADGYGSLRPHFILSMFGIADWDLSARPVALKMADPGALCTGGEALLGRLTDYLFFIGDGRNDANWQASSPGYAGDVAVNGLLADERSSGNFSYRGTITTNATDLGGWNRILNNNPATADVHFGQTDTIAALQQDFDAAVATILALEVTPGFSDMDARDLDGLDVMDGEGKVYVIDISAGFSSSRPTYIYGDADDLFILRWDSDDKKPGQNGTVKLSGGGGIVPLGDLTPASFIHLAGALDSSGGGSTPAALAPYLAELPETVNGGGFFTGYWLTTGDPGKSFENGSFSRATFVGGWYTGARKFSMTSGTAGVHVVPARPPALEPCERDTTRIAGISRLLN